ncbi:MAG TPA: CPBP family intramembrane glutamic endopeptidase [Chloroflexota bacterium]|jgi:membrane protease YdiL (CAAX protease family)|nr:CPBP family intramembrane glutamic endopeptidase [Chloroflexota bacterium]
MKAAVERHPLITYFGLTFCVSWGGALALLLPKLTRGEPIATWYGLLTFPVMLLGPVLASLGLTALLGGRPGLHELFIRMRRWPKAPGWYATVLVAPATLLALLFTLDATVSATFAPNVFLLGFLFGPIAGFLEEIGWTGFALPRMQARWGEVRGSMLLGLAWGLWHLPVVDFLGAASPHGAYLVPFFLAFVAVVTPMRILIGWAAGRTNSIPLAQIIHAGLTGSLAMLSPTPISPAQETAWYAAYAAALWVVVAGVLVTHMRCMPNRMAFESAPM